MKEWFWQRWVRLGGNLTLLKRIITIARKKTLHEVSFVYAGSFLNGVSLFLLNLVLARSLKPESFGAFSLSVLVLGTVSELSDFGLNSGVLRFVPYYMRNDQTAKLKQLVKTVWLWRVGLSIVLMVGGLALSPWIAQSIFDQPGITQYVRLSFWGIGGVVLLGFITTYLQATQRFVHTSTLQALKGVLRVAVVGLLLLVGVTDLTVILGVYIGVPWILLVASYRFLPTGFWRVKTEPAVKREIHKNLARFSFWLTIWSLCTIISARVDQSLISRFLGLEEVALYAVAFQFVFVYSLGLQSITSVLLPKTNAMTNRDELKRLVRHMWRYLLPTTALLAVLIYPTQFLVIWFFGNTYAAAMPLYLVLSYSMLLTFLTIPFSLIITVYNKTELVAFAGAIQLVLNVVLCYLFIPHYGLLGAGYVFGLGIVVSQIYNALAAAYLIKKKELPRL